MSKKCVDVKLVSKLSSIVAVFLARGIASLGFIIISAVTSKYILGSEGQVFIFNLSLLLGISVVARYGRDNALLRFGAVAWNSRGVGEYRELVGFATKSTLRLSCILVPLALMISFSVFGLEAVNSPQVLILLAIPSVALLQIYSSALKAASMPQFGALIEAGAVCFFASILFMLGIEFNVASLSSLPLTFFIGSVILSLSIGFFVSRLSPAGEAANVSSSSHGENMLQPLRDASRPLFLMAFSYYFLQWGVNLVVGFSGDKTAIIDFNAANRLASLIPAALLVVNTLVAPKIANLHDKGSSIELNILVKKVNIITTLIGLPIVLTMLVFPSFVMRELFSIRSDDAVMVLRILAFGQLANLLAGPAMYCLAMTGHEKTLQRIYLSSSIAIFVVVVIVAPIYGIKAVAVSVVIGISAVNFSMAFQVYRKLGVRMLIIEILYSMKSLVAK
tara:strand:- start:2492 stop:3835 length:1344 start_codon:yes stop_codon:yes gene_type:complete